MPEIEVIAYHGWGFDAACWQSIQALIPEFVSWNNFDRGYFGESSMPEFSTDAKTKIVFTHSLGLHFCKDEVMLQADKIVIISGFLHFHPKAAQFRRRSKQVVDEMIKQFDTQPYKVLKAFYRNVFHPQKEFSWPDEEFNQSLLVDDLELLNNKERSFPEVKDDTDIIILHGADDAIVSKHKGRGLYEKFNGSAQYFEIKKSGHALPMIHGRKCWNLIESNLLDTVNE